jgi:anion-transporting  ArsA/GET3 family ATPase
MPSHRLHVVTGKGGVGKSTIAAALAVGAARLGARVLVIELGECGGTCRILGASPPAPGVVVPAAEGTHAAWFDGAAALDEYVTTQLRPAWFFRGLVDHPLYKAFTGAAPGVHELLVMGKVRDELVLQHRWDVVVLDAGASGHALEHLRMPAAASAAFPVGRIHREAEVNAALLRDRAACSIHVVALPEQMPLREAAHTVAALRELDLATGAVFVNACATPAPPGTDAVLAGVDLPELAAVLRRELAWEEIQEREIAALEGELFVRALRVPRVRAPSELERVRALVPAVEGVL